MQLVISMRAVLLSAAILFCSALGHPSQQIDKDATAVKSVKSSSGRSAFEAESESEVSSRTAFEKDGGNDSITRFSNYEASEAAESSHSSSNSETEFTTMDVDGDGDGDLSFAESSKRSQQSSSSSKSESSKTEFEQELTSGGPNSLNDDFEMSYASTSEKSEKESSASQSSSYVSESNTSIDDGIDDNNNNAVQRKSSSFTTEEKEFESENEEKSFVSKQVGGYNAEGIAKDKVKSVENEKAKALGSPTQPRDIPIQPQLEENNNSISSTTQQLDVNQKTEESEKSLASTTTTQQQDINTHVGIPENSVTKGPKNISGTKKSTQNVKGTPKNEKLSKLSPKPTKSSKPRNSSVQSKKVEETRSTSENETAQKSSSTYINEKSVLPKNAGLPVENEEINALNDVTTTTVGIDEILAEGGDTKNFLGYKDSSNVYGSAGKPLVNQNIPIVAQSPQVDIVQKAEEVVSSSSEKKSTELESISATSGNNLLTNLPKAQAPCTPGLPTPSTPCQLPVPENEVPVSTLPAPNLPNVCTETTPPQIPQIPQIVPPASTVENSVQATSISSETTASENKLTATNTQYNSNSEAYPSYHAPYPQYPMYSYDNSPFLVPLDQFPNGQPNQPSLVPQPSNMNYFHSPCNLYLGGYIPTPYPLYAYPPSGQNPPYFQPKYPNVPTNQCPCSNGHPEYPQTSSLPTPQSLPLIPRAIPEDTTNNGNCVPDTVPPVNLPTPLPVESTLPSSVDTVGPVAVGDITQKGLEIAGNPLTIPTLPQASPATPCTAETIPTIPVLPQQPLTPSQELMVKNHIPPYIIADLEKRFEDAKTCILQRYTVYPEDMTELIETAEETTLSYDYLVLGTHASGLTALKTLTETGKRVLILDDARLPPSETYSQYHRLGLLTSDYVTSCSAKVPKTETEKVIHVPKVVGGTLSCDLGVWDHGSLQKFAQWSKTCKLWSWDKIASYYRDLENVEDIGYLNGPINVSHNVPECTLAENIIKSFAEADIHEETYEIDSARSEPGLILLPSMYDTKSGMNFAERIFAEVQDRKNLHMALGLRPVRIVFESDRAVGVEVVTASGKTRVIRVNEEVIVSYGVVNTVKLLQLSGIGDAALLQQHQINVVRNIPQLGKDVLLYPMYPGMFIKCSRGTLLDVSDSDFSALGYAFKETSVQTSLATSSYKAFLQVKGASESNIQINVYTFSYKTTERLMYFMKGVFNFNQETIDFVMQEVADHDIMFLLPQLLDVEVRAQVSIASTDYKASPLIDTHLFESNEDLLVMQKTLTVIKKISKSSVFKEIGGELVQIPVSKCGPTNFSKAFNECSIRELTVASMHLTGGAIMGVDEKTSVVDEQLRLWGTQNVRLLSAAVIPNGVSADSSAISSVIGRYGADMIVKKV